MRPGRGSPCGGVEYTLVAAVPGGDARAQAAFAVVLRARDGRIVRRREYRDRTAIAEALA